MELSSLCLVSIAFACGSKFTKFEVLKFFVFTLTTSAYTQGLYEGISKQGTFQSFEPEESSWSLDP